MTEKKVAPVFERKK